MQMSEALKRARELYVSGERRMDFIGPNVIDYMGLMLEATEDNIDLAADLLLALDEVAPGKNFGFWADGGKWVNEEPVYHYDTKSAEIAAVFGKAIQRAQQREGA